MKMDVNKEVPHNHPPKIGIPNINNRELIKYPNAIKNGKYFKIPTNSLYFNAILTNR